MIDKKSSSLDYPLLVRNFFEASGDALVSKLPPGLYVVATPIGHLGDISLRALVTLANVDGIACEDTRVTGAMLTKFGLQKPLFAYHDHNSETAGQMILEKLQARLAVALVSDAGMPLISDPGYPLIKACREAHIPVTVIPGANAGLTALAGSGLPTDLFHFIGFLPAKKVARRKAIAELHGLAGTLLFYEAPSRVAETLEDLSTDLGAGRQAVVARELTKLFEETRIGTLAELAAHYATADVKGEIVLVVGAAVEQQAPTSDDISALLKDALATQTLRDAVAYVSAVSGIKRGDVYQQALLLTKKDKGSLREKT